MPCRSCAARRRIAGRLQRDGRDLLEIAAVLGVTERRVMRLLEALEDRETLATQPSEEIPTDAVRALFEAWQVEDLEQRSCNELTQLAGYDSASHVQRLLGLTPNTSVTKADGTRYPGRLRERISTDHAERLARAMGHLPSDISPVDAASR